MRNIIICLNIDLFFKILAAALGVLNVRTQRGKHLSELTFARLSCSILTSPTTRTSCPAPVVTNAPPPSWSEPSTSQTQARTAASPSTRGAPVPRRSSWMSAVSEDKIEFFVNACVQCRQSAHVGASHRFASHAQVFCWSQHSFVSCIKLSLGLFFPTGVPHGPLLQFDWILLEWFKLGLGN